MSDYGKAFDGLAQRWAAVENEHDRHHPNRSDCGGVGACTMMRAANTLETEMMEALDSWRRRFARA